jgi:putative oxidoreductase
MTGATLDRPLADAGALLGRILLGALFVWGGIGKALAAGATTAGFAKMGLPAPALAAAVAIAVELGIGGLFVAGLLTRPAALVLGLWCIATAIVAHSDFSDRNMQIHFFKNIAMCGGFIYAALLGPGAYSIDALLERRRPDRMAPRTAL